LESAPPKPSLVEPGGQAPRAVLMQSASLKQFARPTPWITNSYRRVGERS
jgi:hypothetical protein